MGKFSHILLAVDLDGTFFGTGVSLLEKNLQAIDHFKENGGYFTVNTGRMYTHLLRLLPTASPICNAPVITSNGAYICDFCTGDVLQSTKMDPLSAKEAVMYLQKTHPHVGVRISTADGFLVNANCMSPRIRKDVQSDTFVGEVIPAEEWQTENAEWYKLVVRGEAEELSLIREELYHRYQDVFAFAMSAPTLFEMNDKRCSKATGLSFVADHLQAGTGQKMITVAMGDQENDLPMMMSADLSACPQNATDEVKALATMHLCHHTEGAVAHLIDYLDKIIPFHQ